VRQTLAIHRVVAREMARMSRVNLPVLLVDECLKAMEFEAHHEGMVWAGPLTLTWEPTWEVKPGEEIDRSHPLGPMLAETFQDAIDVGDANFRPGPGYATLRLRRDAFMR
jgi:hypothetical protein